MKRLLAASLLFLAVPAHAVMPESGWWWYPAESGRGFNLEIQDNVVVMSAYVYEADGRPVWYLAIGTLQNSRFSATLDRYEGGQCIGCPYDDEPDPGEGAGPVEIRFSSSTRGELTWNDGETVPIRRHNFNLGDQITLMLGRWQMVTDVSEVSEEIDPFFGDVLVFDRDTTDGTDDFFEGYRPHSEYDRAGRPGNRPSLRGDAAGLYEPESGLHVILVDDTDEFWLAYYVTVGTNGFEGIAEFYQENPTFSGYPVTGFRSKGRSAVPKAATEKSTADAGSPVAARDPALAGPGPASLQALLGAHAKSANLEAVERAVRHLQATLEARAAGD